MGAGIMKRIEKDQTLAQPYEKDLKKTSLAVKKKQGKPVPVGKASKISPKPSVLPPFEARKDRVGRYFKKYMKDFVFDEFSPSYIAKLGNSEFLNGVSIPLRPEDLESFAGGAGLKPTVLAENIISVMGIDPKFKFVPAYVEFMNRCFGPKILEGILKAGRDFAEKGEMDLAAIHFRGILVLKSDYKDGMYSYARACRELYINGTDEEYIGRFKAESIECFEHLTEIYPRFAEAYYFLGYGYLNMGLYQKAELTWKEFLRTSNNPKDKKEIRQRMEQLKQPIEIERGCNCTLSGRFEEAIQILEPFLDTQFKTWWPLSYYLGVAYARTGKSKHAFINLKRAINLNPSHIETMNELADLYALTKDKENETKYRKKAELVSQQLKAGIEIEPDSPENEEIEE